MAEAALTSVLMPCRNAAQTLVEAVASVQAQTRPDWELLIVDDGSTDGTVELVQTLRREDPRIRLVGQVSGQGAAAARNLALASATGRYIAFLDADDLWHPDKLELQLAFMARRGAALSHTSYHVQTRRGTRYLRRAPETLSRAELLCGNRIGCLSVIYDRARIGSCPMPLIARRHDYALWLQMLSRTDLAHGLDIALALHRRRQGSLSAHPIRATISTFDTSKSPNQ